MLNIKNELLVFFCACLTGVNVRVIIDDTTRQDNVFDAPAVKKRVQVYVYGTLVHTGEKRCFYYVIYLGPISTR